MTAPAISRSVPAPDILSAHLGDESILLDLYTKHYFRLNDSAAVIWRGLEQRERTEAIVARVLAQFDVSEDEARAAIAALLADLRSKRLIAEAERG